MSQTNVPPFPPVFSPTRCEVNTFIQRFNQEYAAGKMTAILNFDDINKQIGSKKGTPIVSTSMQLGSDNTMHRAQITSELGKYYAAMSKYQVYNCPLQVHFK